MANLNKVMLIGRLTRDPEPITDRSGAALARGGAKFGFAVNNRKFNQDTQTWEDDPVFIDMEIYNRGENSKQADRVLQTLRKGQQVFIEGHLRFHKWINQDDKQTRTKLSVVVDNFQYLDARQEGEGMRSAPQSAAPRQTTAAGAQSNGSSSYSESDYHDEPEAPRGPVSQGKSGGEDDIPF
jgi:single-strand DNA-binding protein